MSTSRSSQRCCPPWDRCRGSSQRRPRTDATASPAPSDSCSSSWHDNGPSRSCSTTCTGRTRRPPTCWRSSFHRPPSTRVLLGLAARAGRAPDVEAALETAVRNDSADVVDVGPLSREAADALLPSLQRAARERVYVESGGNPFYLDALARAAAADPYRRAATGMAGVPRAVRAALAGEVGVLPADMREVLEGAAVAGDPFEPELAGAAVGVSETVVLSALDELLGADLIRATDQPRRFRFRHPLVRRAVYEGTAGGSRLAAHARAAEALAARGATPAQRAHHVERAARPGDLHAIDLLAAAAAETVPRAPATAAGWYGSALRLLPDGSQHDERRLALLRAQADALVAANRVVEARDALRRALGLLTAAAAVERAEMAASLAHLEVWIGNTEDARNLLSAARAELDHRARTRVRAPHAGARPRARLVRGLRRRRTPCGGGPRRRAGSRRSGPRGRRGGPRRRGGHHVPTRRGRRGPGQGRPAARRGGRARRRSAG